MAEEEQLELVVEKSAHRVLLCRALLFYGRGGYRPWAEIFSLRANIPLGGEPFAYFDSSLEVLLLQAFVEALPPGGALHGEYDEDAETRFGLVRGYPPVVTRLGYRLFSVGLTWFKDWYFSEGGHEGGMKLTASLPLHEANAQERLQERLKEVQDFLERTLDLSSVYARRAVERANKLLRTLREV